MTKLKLMAVATTVCLFASGCGSNAAVSSDVPLKSNSDDATVPMVTFGKMSMTISPDKDFDPRENIVSVKDDVDGDLEYVEGSGSKSGKYTVECDDMTKVGYHAVTVTATDNSGNKAVRYYHVKVTEDKNEVAESEKTTTISETKEDTASDSKSSTSSSATKSNPSTKTSGSSSTSKPSSGLSNSNSATKPSTGGSTSSGSNSVAKPSGGSSNSSSATKPSSGNSSSSSGGSTTKPTTPTCKTETINHPAETHTVNHPAETHTVEHPAETRWVVDVPAHDEPIYADGIVCNTCGTFFTAIEDFRAHTQTDDTSPCFLSGWHSGYVQTGTNHIPEQGHTEVVKPAWTETVVDKEAWTETVTDKPAWAETKEVCG